jgi:capsule polysaccharide export protein KpsE/RkpR
MTPRGCKALCGAGVVAAAFLAGCSSASTSAGSSPAASSAPASSAAASASASDKAAVCASVSKLKDDVVALKDVNIRANGTSAVSAQLTKIQQQLDVVKSDARGQFSPQVTNLSNAVSTLGSSLTAARENLNSGTLATLAASVGAVVTAGNSLVSAASSTC